MTYLFSWTAGFTFSAAYGFHILLDIFTHKAVKGLTNQKFDTGGGKYLYPWKNKNMKIGLVHWRQKKFLIVNYALLAIVYAVKWLS